MSTKAEDILLVGSVPLHDSREVMATCGDALGNMTAGIPDGETADRSVWIVYQAYRVFAGHPDLETVARPAPIDGHDEWIPKGMDDMWSFRVKEDVEQLRFDDLKYASVAEESYPTFVELRKNGGIAEDVRFQVSLPTPEAMSFWFHDPGQLQTVIPAYTDAMVREVDKLLGAIPHRDLSLQWDVCWEVLDAEGILPWSLTATGASSPLGRFRTAIQRLSAPIPEAVRLGYHLCYADLGHKHMREPDDVRVCVDFANVAAKESGRRVDYVHMPVPIARDDDGYFAPLADLDVGDTRIYLGLVHFTDGLEGTRKRMRTALGHLSDFGIATECGFGRRPQSQVPALLQLHVDAAEELRTMREQSSPT